MIKDTANLAFHPVANIFPLMEGKPFEDICDSIQQNGLLEPIWLYQMQIIDGRNRYRACIETGTAPRFRTYEGDEGDLVAFVVALNLHRRHLSESQRAMVAEKRLETGIPLRLFHDYEAVQEASGLPVELVFIHGQEGEVRGNTLNNLSLIKRVYEGNSMSYGGMVFFPYEMLPVITSLDEISQAGAA